MRLRALLPIAFMGISYSLRAYTGAADEAATDPEAFAEAFTGADSKLLDSPFKRHVAASAETKAREVIASQFGDGQGSLDTSRSLHR